MGNTIDTRSQFPWGYLYVKTDRPYYYPGNQVNGTVYIRTQVAMNPSHMNLEIKGKEKSSHTYTEFERIEREGQVEQRPIKRKQKNFSKILEFKGRCWTF